VCYIKLIFNYLQVDWKNGNIKVRSIFKEFLNLSKSDRTLLLLRKDYSASSFAHSNERLTAFFQPL